MVTETFLLLAFPRLDSPDETYVVASCMCSAMGIPTAIQGHKRSLVRQTDRNTERLWQREQACGVEGDQLLPNWLKHLVQGHTVGGAQTASELIN
jgi:hypothetical protein